MKYLLHAVNLKREKIYPDDLFSGRIKITCSFKFLTAAPTGLNIFWELAFTKLSRLQRSAEGVAWCYQTAAPTALCGRCFRILNHRTYCA
jgi:hypothetical protein